ncbi:gliding motility-associated C-terminal domain-containing protein, partial [Lishizhenia tianjinensis]
LYYYCIITLSGGGCSEIVSNTAQVIVQPQAIIDVQPLAFDSICVGGSINNPLTVSYTQGVGNPSYQWFVNGTQITNNSPSFTPPNFNTTGDYFVEVIIDLDGNGCDAVGSDSTHITVLPDPVINLQPIDAIYCQNASNPDTLVVSASGGLGNYSYQWFSNTTNNNTSGNAIPGATDSTFVPNVSNIGDIYYYCEVTQTGANCNVTSNTALIQITPAPVFSTLPLSTQDLCLDGIALPLEVNYQNGTSSANYQWYVNTVNSNSGGVIIPGATSNIYTPLSDSSTLGSNYYYCIISFNIGGCSEIISPVGQVNVYPQPVISIQPLENDSLCAGGTLSSPLEVAYSSGIGNPSYQWYLGNVSLVNDTLSTYTPPMYSTTGNFNYSVEIELDGNGCNLLTSDTSFIVILPDPIITLQPQDAEYCQNSQSTLPLSVSSTGGIGANSYQWYYNVSTNTSAGTLIPGATDSTYIPSTAIVGTVYYYCVLTQTGVDCSTTSQPAAIVVNAPPSIDQHPIGYQELCLGGSTIPLSTSYINGTGTGNYQWYVNTTYSSQNGTIINGATTSSYTPPSNQVDSLYYYCEINFLTGGCDMITSNIATVVINIDPIITVDPIVSQTICFEDPIDSALSISHQGGVGNPIYQWYLVGSPNQAILGETDSSYFPIMNQPGNFNYFVTLNYTGNGCDVDTSQLAEIIVNPLPTLTNIMDTLICNNTLTNISLSASITSNFNWLAIDNPNVSGETLQLQNTSFIQDSLTNTTSSPQIVEYIVTPISIVDNCPGRDTIIQVIVQPDIELSMPTSIEICSGSPVNVLLASNVAAEFSWFVSIDNPNVSGESISTSTNTLINDYLINNSNTNQVVVYSVFPVSTEGNCIGEAQPLVVTVKPPIELISSDSLAVCSNTPLNLHLVANTNVNFSWYADPSVDILNETTSVVNGDIIDDILENLVNFPQEVIYHVIATSTVNGCSSPIIPVSVFVNPIPTVDPLTDTIFCHNEIVAPISFNGPVNGSIYTWTSSNTSTGLYLQNDINSLPGFTANNTSGSINTSTINVLPSFSNFGTTCYGSSTSFNLQVLPQTDVSPLLDIEICDNNNVVQITPSSSIASTQFNWSNSNTDVGLNANGIGHVPAFVATNTSINDIISTVTITPSFVLNNHSCDGVAVDYTITVHPSPKVLNTDIEICSEQSTDILLNATLPSQFEWIATPTPNVYNETSFPLQNNSYINDNLVNNTLTSHVVEYTVTATSNLNGCIGPDSTLEVTVHPLPIVGLEIITDPICEQSPVAFQNNSIGNLDFMWYFGDGDSSFLVNPTHIYDSMGVFNLSLHALNPLNGCTNEIDTIVSILPIPNAEFIISDSIGCDVLNVLFTAEETQPSWNYQWYFGDLDSSAQFGLAGYQFTEIGCHDISLTVTDITGCASNNTMINGVCLYKTPIASIYIDNSTISTFDPTVQFINQSLYATSYVWDFGDGSSSIVEHPVHTYPDYGQNYTIILTASNEIGCSDTTQKTITIKEDLILYVPNTFTPNADDFNNVFKPILAQGYDQHTYNLKIYNRWGELVFESNKPTIGWNGSVHNLGNNICKDGTYTWILEIDALQDGERKQFTGHVNLIK